MKFLASFLARHCLQDVKLKSDLALVAQSQSCLQSRSLHSTVGQGSLKASSAQFWLHIQLHTTVVQCCAGASHLADRSAHESKGQPREDDTDNV
jgi:hypothetical protein